MKWGDADFDELRKLGENINKMQGLEWDRFCADCARELALRLLALVIPATPVGHKPTLTQLGGAGAKKYHKVKVNRTRLVNDEHGYATKVKKQTVTQSFLSREGAILEKHWSGYVGGSLRRGWIAGAEKEAAAGKGTPQAAEIKEFVKQIPVTKEGTDYVITVTNQMHYASYVEDGHRQTPGRYVPAIGRALKKSWVPGKNMLKISEAKLRTAAPALIEKKLNAFLKEGFNVGGN